MSLRASLRTELLLAAGRIALERVLALSGEYGEVLEIALPDGTLNRAVVPAPGGQVSGLLFVSDKTVQVCSGDVAQNQPLTLRPWGVYALLDSDMPADSACVVSYTPGDGSVATCAVLFLGRTAGCARFALHPTLSQQLMRCYDLDELSGTRADHVSGVALQEGGTPTAGVPGKVGRAASFTGTNWLQAGGDGTMFQPPFTLAFWMQIDAYPSPQSWCLVGSGYTLNAGQYFFYCIVRPDDHLLQMSVGSGFRGLVSSVAPPSLGAWHLVIAWASSLTPGDSGTTNIQLDNGPIASTGNGAHVDPFGAPLVVGAIGSAADRMEAHYHGRLDQLLYWPRALTAAERTDVWNAGRG